MFKANPGKFPLTNTQFKIIIRVLFLSFLTAFQSPPNPIWELFSTTKFTEKLNKKFGLYFYYPVFNKELTALEGKVVELKGFYIPLDMKQSTTIILSKYPMAECFFCGGSGPESVAVVHLKNLPSRKLKMDQIIKVRGTLQLNAHDVEEMTFILKYAEILD
jgi:hypothetical protein